MIIKLTDDEVAARILIFNKITCARQAMSPSIIPNDATPAQVDLYMNSVLGILSGYEWLEQDWIKRMKEKYNIQANGCNIIFDLRQGSLIVEDSK